MIFALAPVIALAQGALSLSLPVDCAIGQSCVVQNYVDRDPGAAARDYRCGWLSYDGHKGTDIRVIDAAALQRGVVVVAAAPGRVRAVRDGMADVSVRLTGKEAVKGREAGNSVVVQHGDGWETQYSHLREGSVAVRPGARVERGQKLGVVGLSGRTEFPHLHFEVRHLRETVDPFVGLGAAEPCQPGSEPLWRGDALAALAYFETGVLDSGIAGAPPRLIAGGTVDEGTQGFDEASAAAVFWVQIYGARKGDREDLRLVSPDGKVLAQKRNRLSRNRAQWFSYAGRRRGELAWPAGVYRGEYALYRGQENRKILAIAREAQVAPAQAGRSDGR